VTGGYVALALALKKLRDLSEIKANPLINYVSAISVGLHEGNILLDLNYEEDSAIGTDMNFVMTNKGQFVEVQGTAEHHPFSREQLFKMMDVAEKGCRELFMHQASVVGEFFQLAGK
jgi:ribonuclease PH